MLAHLKKWKYDMEKLTHVIIDKKSIFNSIQFETIIWAKYNTQWQWNKLLKFTTLV